MVCVQMLGGRRRICRGTLGQVAVLAATIGCGGQTAATGPGSGSGGGSGISIAKVSGDSQTATLGTALANPVVVRVTDSAWESRFWCHRDLADRARIRSRERCDGRDRWSGACEYPAGRWTRHSLAMD